MWIAVAISRFEDSDPYFVARGHGSSEEVARIVMREDYRKRTEDDWRRYEDAETGASYRNWCRESQVAPSLDEWDGDKNYQLEIGTWEVGP